MQNKQYDGPPSTFVNVKRVKAGEQDDKGREKTVLTFGLQTDRNGNEVNTCDQLIEALEQYRGKQVNIDIRVGEAESAQGRKFPTAFVRIYEMIPKDAQAGRVAFVPKKPSRTDDVKARAAKIQQDFKG